MHESPNDMTEVPSLMMKIRPTRLERAVGRLLRGPDHSASDGGDDASGSADDASGDGDQAGGGDSAGDSSGDADDTSTLGAATTGDGAGDSADDADSDGKGGDDDQKDDVEGPPEAYDLKVTIKDAEGKDQAIEVDPVLVTKATPIFKDLKLTNEQANKITALVPEVQARLAEQQNDDFAAMRAAWAKDAADAAKNPDIGGKNWKSTVSFAGKAMDHFVGPSEKDEKGQEKNEFRALLNETGLGEHPAMIRAFRKIGEALGEDSTLARGQQTVERKPREEVMYPEDAPKKK
jgi:hypothetical protein